MKLEAALNLQYFFPEHRHILKRDEFFWSFDLIPPIDWSPILRQDRTQMCHDGTSSGISVPEGASSDILQVVSEFWMPNFDD